MYADNGGTSTRIIALQINSTATEITEYNLEELIAPPPDQQERKAHTDRKPEWLQQTRAGWIGYRRRTYQRLDYRGPRKPFRLARGGANREQRAKR